MAIRINGFRAMAPRVSPELLASNQAQAAVETNLLSGEIRALREPELVQDLGTEIAGTVFRWRPGAEDVWLRFPGHVDVIAGPVADDVHRRIYWTGDSRYDAPRMSYTPAANTGTGTPPIVSYQLGVPAPEGFIAATPVEPGTATITAVHLERPIRVETEAEHGLESGAIVQFTVQAEELPNFDGKAAYALGDRVRYDDASYEATSAISSSSTARQFNYEQWKHISDLDSYLNLGEHQIQVTSPTEFTIDHSDAANADFTRFASGTVEAYYSPGLLDTRFYVYTYVTNLGEEGPPSTPGSAVEVGRTQPVELELPAIEAQASTGRLIERRRIYRTATGNAGAAFQFVAEVSINATAFLDAVDTDALGEVIPSTEWDPPPADLKGLRVTANGIGVGFSGNQVCLSEPYQLHAWPTGYRYTLDYEIVAVEVIDGSIVVATTGRPYLLQGNDPAAMLPRRLAVSAACVSARSMVSLGYSAVFASAEGLVYVDGSGASLFTRQLLTEREWAGYTPSSIHAYELDGRYMAFYAGGGFVLDPREADIGLWEIAMTAVSGYRDALDPKLFLLTDDNQIVRFDAGTARRRYRWRSKVFPLGRPSNFAAAKVTAAAYDDLTFRLFADGVLLRERAVTGPQAFRLPAGRAYRRLEVELEGSEDVKALELAESATELEP